jgi:hypothetical protein
LSVVAVQQRLIRHHAQLIHQGGTLPSGESGVKSVRKAFIGLLLAATTATPVAALAQDDMQITERYQRQGERNQERHERRQERQERRAERPAPSAEVQQERAANRAERQQQRAERQAQQIEAPAFDREERREAARRAMAENLGATGQGDRREDRRADRREDRQERRADRREDRREDRQERREESRDAFRERIRETREAAARGQAEVIPRYARQGQRNQERYERQLREERRDRRDARREWRRDRDYLGWQNDWRRDRRYDWQRYRYSNRHIYRPGRYYSPYRDHSYSRFSIGFFLQPGFFSNRYWINDPWQYRLPAAYPGTRWVRYYDDVLLVDVYTGEVVDVIHDFFW